MVEKDEVWEHYSEENPYFGVFTIDKFKDENLNEAAKDEFFQSGEAHIERIWKEIEDSFCKDFKPKRALDFGCGVGRLVLPLSARCEEVIGVDISAKMLAEAQKNCAERGIENASFVLSDTNLSKAEGKFDLIHSFVVFQHINPQTGEQIFQKMLEKLSDGGIGVLQFTFHHRADKASVFRFKLYRDFPAIYRLRNLLIKQKQEPLMPMYEYNLNRLFLLLKDNGCHKSMVRFSYHGFDGAVIFFQKINVTDY